MRPALQIRQSRCGGTTGLAGAAVCRGFVDDLGTGTHKRRFLLMLGKKVVVKLFSNYCIVAFVMMRRTMRGQ